jgi:membrane protease YdiL (CAAX protease family)
MARIVRPAAISGWQLAILIYAIGILGVPTAMGLASWLSAPPGDAAYLSQVIAMTAELLVICAVPALRVRAAAFIRAALVPKDFPEITLLCMVVIAAQFALFGGFALANWFRGGDDAVRGMILDPARGPDQAFAGATFRNLAITTLLAPVVEELVFRGFLFEAWRQHHRTITAMILTSAVFAMCHVTFPLPFALGLILNSLYVRTGSLRSTMFVHFVANVAFWYPLMGQFLFPGSNAGLSSWKLHLACLAAFAGFMVIYPIVASTSASRRARGVASSVQ